MNIDAVITIGVHRDDQGEPVITIGEQRICTTAAMRDLIATYEKSQPSSHGGAGDDYENWAFA